MQVAEVNPPCSAPRLSGSTSLLLRRENGWSLPETPDHRTLSLSPASLHLLLAVSAGKVKSLPDTVQQFSRRYSVDPAQLEQFVQQLVARGLLIDPASSSTASPTPTGVGVPHSPTGHFDDLVAEPEKTLLVASSPMFFWVRSGHIEWWDHSGTCRVRLRANQAGLVAAFGKPVSLAKGLAIHADQGWPSPLTGDDALQVLRKLWVAGIFGHFDPDDPEHRLTTEAAQEATDRMRTGLRIRSDMKVLTARHEAAESERIARGESPRVQVVGVHESWMSLPVSLGLLFAAAQAHDGGALQEHYSFHPCMLHSNETLRQVARTPGIYLYSNYVWSSTLNLGFSAVVKEVSGCSVNIHGGPDTPSHPGDVERYFAENPHVDVAVHGEGEATIVAVLEALRGWDGTTPPDLSVLADVAGLSYRDGDRVVTTPKRDRIEDLDTIPSPYLAGVFDSFRAAGLRTIAVVETNRGCPYGCTFCDWGSATNSRIRKFDLERVFSEIEWLGEHQIGSVMLGDANFGIFERDVEIAEKIAEVKARYGYPQYVINNYAKNTAKHLSKIISIFAGAGILTEGKVSLQSMDETTLLTIRRKNIKTEKYNDLAAEFTANRLPLAAELMFGLPGSTVDSFRRDLQQTVDRNVRAFVYPTLMLPNSPMNEPSYRAEHGIVARAGEHVTQTNTFTTDDWVRMDRLRVLYTLGDFYGTLRQVSLHVRRVTGAQEIDFFMNVDAIVRSDREAFPILWSFIESGPYHMITPVSWGIFIAEVRSLVTQHLGVPDDTALATVLAVQHAHLPARDRRFPQRLELEHDYAAWYREVERLRQGGHRTDWELHVPALDSFGPGEMVVDDPSGRTASVNWTVTRIEESVQWWRWEVESSVARASVHEVIELETQSAADADFTVAT